MSHNINMKNKFSDKLIELRNENGLSQNGLAKELGFSRTAISSWELGVREPSFDTLISIAKYFKVTIDYILGLEDY